MKYIGFLVILLMPSLVLAGTISLTTSSTTDVLTNNTSYIKVVLTNFGDEAAYNVQLSLVTNYFSSNPIHVGTLDINKPFETNFSIFAKDAIKEGNYPTVLMTEYTDANGYPFSSVSPVTLTYKNPYSSKVMGVFSDVSISGKGSKNLVLKLRNMDQASHNVKVKLTLPNELSSDSVEKSIEINSKEEKNVVFRVSNFGALEGSSYVVLAAIEYEDNYHYSSIARGMIKVVQEKSLVIPTWLPLTAVAILVVIFVVYEIKSRFAIKVSKEKTNNKSSR
jgi:hypothetical protein